MVQVFEIQSGEKKQFMSALYSEPSEMTTPEHTKTLVIMVHGFPDSHKQAHKDLFGDLEYLFTTSGLHTLRFDMRCCGSSEGLQEEFTLQGANTDMDAILDWAHKQGFEKIIYVAEGLGAAHVARKINKTTRLAFFFWPILDLKSFCEKHYLGAAQQDTINVPHIIVNKNRIGLPLIEEMRQTDLTPYLHDLRAPILMQYGLQDTLADKHQIDYFLRHTKAPLIDVTSYEDGENGLHSSRHRQMIFYHIGQFLSKFS